MKKKVADVVTNEKVSSRDSVALEQGRPDINKVLVEVVARASVLSGLMHMDRRCSSAQ